MPTQHLFGVDPGWACGRSFDDESEVPSLLVGRYGELCLGCVEVALDVLGEMWLTQAEVELGDE